MFILSDPEITRGLVIRGTMKGGQEEKGPNSRGVE
jgi:hypothetical protein